MGDEQLPSRWLQQLQEGDSLVAYHLWETYYSKLVSLARRKLEGRVHLVADEEDVALSALKSFCRGVERGRYQQISDPQGLWNLLVAITLHKVLHLVRDEGRAKRGGGRRIESPRDASAQDHLQQLVSQEPSAEVAAQLAEQADRLLGQLPTPDLVELALLKIEGYTNEEIARRWQKAERTVERKLNLIRKIWEKDAVQTH